MTREEQIDLKAAGIGINFRDALVCNNIERDAAENLSLIAQSKFKEGANWADENPNLEEWFDNIHVWLMNNDKLREMIGISKQYELVTELRKFLNIKHYEK